MLEASGEIALFTDADLSTPIEEADKLLAALRDGDMTPPLAPARWTEALSKSTSP